MKNQGDDFIGFLLGAGYENRTRASTLGRSRPTTKPIPHQTENRFYHRRTSFSPARTISAYFLTKRSYLDRVLTQARTCSAENQSLNQNTTASHTVEHPALENNILKKQI